MKTFTTLLFAMFLTGCQPAKTPYDMHGWVAPEVLAAYPDGFAPSQLIINEPDCMYPFGEALEEGADAWRVLGANIVFTATQDRQLNYLACGSTDAFTWIMDVVPSSGPNIGWIYLNIDYLSRADSSLARQVVARALGISLGLSDVGDVFSVMYPDVAPWNQLTSSDVAEYARHYQAR